MGSLMVSMSVSVDGYVADRDGRFDFTEPDAEVHRFIDDRLRSVGTYLLGRKLYEVMEVWDTLEVEVEPDHVRDFAQEWRAAEKVVYSRTLSSVTGPRTRLERSFDPEAVRRLKETSERDLEVGGPGLAANAFRAGLVDEVQLYLVPVALGGGTALFPEGQRIDLELLETRRFDNGTVFLRHRVR